MNNNEAANKMEKIIAIWKLSQKSSSKKRKLSIVSLCIYIYSSESECRLFYSGLTRTLNVLNEWITNLHAIAADWTTVKEIYTRAKHVNRIKRKWQILKTGDSYILYSGNVLFRVSKGNSTYVPQVRADIPLVIIDYYREMQTKYKRIFE